jgi:hypothetical protein
MRRLLIAGLAAAAAAAPATAQTDAQATARGAAWIERQTIGTVGQQADAIVALAAAGRPRSRLQARLARMLPAAPGYATTAGAAGKVVLAAVAAGRDPRRLGGVNYVARLRARYAGGRFGAGAYDQLYAMLALRAARERVPPAAVAALRNTRGPGGWNFSLRPSRRDDVTVTGLAIEALRAVGVPPSDPMLRGARAWLVAQANTGGGFHIDGGGRATEANSTAIAVRALRAMGHPVPAARARLRALQEGDGGFRFTATVRESRLLATVDAVLALSGRRLPPPYPVR